ncbi:hypothetical protein GGI25_003273 [Coemansia spiralis]|uniref:Coiled-coil domain-containing protein 16 n=2 Tax=Coemansia TaxID=4863 RepID=A0A9W8G6D6_9FUNG|nr:hypothetical protein BX070DRAFT_231184 [Coemansia spiralis]KAJ1989985.1 hypothetical protein EDC05_004337 [Coemansia umbellata]KAJ2621500.1 hypothetical protein GGI26_004080 [Coemansia sp. RSA 1358]KAJ2677176.1 hypothetical protein GGI25_003273 [Coemansia spiralis]
MQKPTARDLLRKAREQKKQAPQNAPSLLASDPLLQIDKTGLVCLLCKAKVKPANAAGWSAHKASKRHAEVATPESLKRQRDGNPPRADVADSLATRLSINREQQNESKRPKLVAYESEKEDVGSDVATGAAKDTEEIEETGSIDAPSEHTGLPSNFFDAGVSRTEYSDQESIDGAAQPEDTGSSAPGKVNEKPPQLEAENKTFLQESLAEFESEVLGLTLAQAKEEEKERKEEKDNSVDDLERQSETWQRRTQKLIELRQIIVDGAIEEEQVSAQSQSSSSDEDFGDLVDWRMGSM